MPAYKAQESDRQSLNSVSGMRRPQLAVFGNDVSIWILVLRERDRASTAKMASGSSRCDG